MTEIRFTNHNLLKSLMVERLKQAVSVPHEITVIIWRSLIGAPVRSDLGCSSFVTKEVTDG